MKRILFLSRALITYTFWGIFIHSAFSQKIPNIGFDPGPLSTDYYSLPTIDLDRESQLQVVVDKEKGQYLGHPTTHLLEDGKTILCTYPKGHGRGPIVMKRSEDGGLTWSDRLARPLQLGKLSGGSYAFPYGGCFWEKANSIILRLIPG